MEELLTIFANCCHARVQVWHVLGCFHVLHSPIVPGAKEVKSLALIHGGRLHNFAPDRFTLCGDLHLECRTNLVLKNGQAGALPLLWIIRVCCDFRRWRSADLFPHCSAVILDTRGTRGRRILPVGNHVTVGAAKTERANACVSGVEAVGYVFREEASRKALYIQVRVCLSEVDGGTTLSVQDLEDALAEARYAGAALQVTQVALRCGNKESAVANNRVIDPLERTDLNRVTERCTRAMALEAISILGRQPCLLKGRVNALLLRRSIGSSDARAATVLVGLAASNKRKTVPAVVLQIQVHTTHALTAHVPVRGGIKCEATAPERQHGASATADESSRGIRQIDATAN
mmetsp:Transcript_23437/g.49909  ORF Transcript_23437/g.49909 Transcript_23437/m.49909 type:complete len:347 (+) Transcript_23437:419-1459(+)